VQIVDNGTSTQIEEFLAQSAIACAPSLPPTHMGQGMFDSHSFTSFAPSLSGLLTLASLTKQSFIGMDADTAAPGTGGAVFFE